MGGKGFLEFAEAAFAAAGEHLLEVRVAEELSGFPEECALGLELAQGDFGGDFVGRADGVGQDGDVLSPGEQAQDGGFDSAFGGGADDEEFVGLEFAEEAVGAGFLEGVVAAFIQDDLVIVFEEVAREVGRAVGGEGNMTPADGIGELSLAFGIGQTVAMPVAGFVNLLGGHHADVFEACPGHDPADVLEHPAVITDATGTLGEEKIPLGIHVHKHPSSPQCNNRPNHFGPLMSRFYHLYGFSRRQFLKDPENLWGIDLF